MNCSNPKVCTHILQIYWIYKDAIDLIYITSRWKVRFRQTFLFKMKYKKCFISWCWSHTLAIILGGLTALY